MAKHCDVCNRDYADDLPVCPHCATAKKTQLASSPVEDRRTQLADIPAADQPAEPTPSDSAIDLGPSPTSKPRTGDAAGVPPASISGISAVEWSALIEEPSAKHEAAPSDSHEEIVGELAAPTSSAPVEESPQSASEVIDLSTSPPPAPESPPSSSAVDLGAPLVELVEEDFAAIPAQAPPSGSQVFMAELASDASRVDLVGDSGIHFADEEIVELASASDSRIVPLAESPSGNDPIAEVVEAGIDPNTPEAELTEQVALDALGVDEHSSAVDLGAPASLGFEEVSAVSAGEVVDLPEGSGIDLKGLSIPSGADSHAAMHPSSESSVDLGSHPEIAALSASGEALEAAFLADSGVDLGKGGDLTAAPANDSNLAFESLLSESPSGTPPAEESAAVVEDEAVAEVTDEEAALAAVDEPVVSEAEVDDLLAGLEESSTGADDLATMAVEEAAASDVAEGEEAVAEAEEELAAETEAEAEAEEEEERPAKPVKQRSRIPALVGGTFVGLLLGAGGLIGARVGGVDVPAMMGLGEQKKAAAPVVPQTKAPTPEERAAFLNNGDWAGAAKAGIEQIQETDPKQLASRGSYRLGVYLEKVGAKINPQDPALQPALTDLQNAAKLNDLDAIYDLGLINELARNLNEARAEYTKGVKAAQNDPAQKQRFQAALDRVELKASDKVPGAAFAPLPQGVEDRAALLALLLIGLQQPPAVVPPAGAQPPASSEAGFDFWEAAKQARKGDFAKAIQALDKARAAHDQRRFTRLRKAQNPLSDPTEDIFLRCCDELKQYWSIESNLRERNYLTDKNTGSEALKDLLKKADTSAEIVKAVTDQCIKEKVIASPDDDVAKGVDRLITDKKDADTKVADLTTKLEKSTKNATDLADKLKTADDTIKDYDTKLKSAAALELKLKAANDDLSTTFKKIADELTTAKFLDPKAKAADIGEAVRKAVDLAKIKDPQGLIRTQRSELARMTASLSQRWRPEEMMPLWRALLEQNRTRGELATKAAIDVDRVKADPQATPAQNGQAQIVLGLALRNTEKFDEAKTVLQAARTAVDQGEWLAVADAALREVSDPAAYYSREAQTLYDRGAMNAALAVLARAMQTLPAKDQARLLAQRSLIELDAAQAKTKGRMTPTEPLLIAARKDAAEAAKAGLAEGHYAVGRIAEELGQWNAAIESYRKASAAHPALDAEGSRYRIALARVLVQPRDARRGAAGNKVGWLDPAAYPARHRADMRQLLLLITLGLQAPGVPDEDAATMAEAQKLADEVLRTNGVPFNLRAQAMAIQGRWTPALQTYVEGIRPLLPREYGNGLMYLLLNHPRLKRPDSLRVPNPAKAEQHFAAGLSFYFDRDYANAESEFLLAVENDSQDARYFYFLGLSRLSQSRRRDAYADFNAGAILERQNRPAPAAVSESLERIQGPTRRIVNEIRNRPER